MSIGICFRQSAPRGGPFRSGSDLNSAKTLWPSAKQPVDEEHRGRGVGRLGDHRHTVRLPDERLHGWLPVDRSALVLLVLDGVTKWRRPGRTHPRRAIAAGASRCPGRPRFGPIASISRSASSGLLPDETQYSHSALNHSGISLSSASLPFHRGSREVLLRSGRLVSGDESWCSGNGEHVQPVSPSSPRAPSLSTRLVRRKASDTAGLLQLPSTTRNVGLVSMTSPPRNPAFFSSTTRCEEPVAAVLYTEMSTSYSSSNASVSSPVDRCRPSCRAVTSPLAWSGGSTSFLVRASGLRPSTSARIPRRSGLR